MRIQVFTSAWAEIRAMPRGGFGRNVTGAVLFQGLAAAFAIANSAIIARSLGAGDFGMIALALLVPGMLELFLSCGIGVANVYFAGSRRLDATALLAHSLVFASFATGIGGLLVAVLLSTGWLDHLLPGVPGGVVALAALALPVGLLNSYFAAIAQGLQRVRAVSAIGALQALVALVLTAILLVGMGSGVTGVLVALLLAGIVSAGLLLAVLRAEGARLSFRICASVSRDLLSFGMRGHLGNVLQYFNYRLDALILNIFLGPATVGVYTVAVRLAELLWHLPNAVGFVLLPKAAATAPATMNALTARVFKATLAITAVAAAGLAVVGLPLIRMVYSAEFDGAFVPLLVLLPGIVALGGAKILTNDMAGRGYPQYNSANAGIALVVTIVLDLLLIPAYGIVGAALASTAAYTLILATALLFHRAARRAPATLLPGALLDPPPDRMVTPA